MLRRISLVVVTAMIGGLAAVTAPLAANAAPGDLPFAGGPIATKNGAGHSTTYVGDYVQFDYLTLGDLRWDESTGATGWMTPPRVDEGANRWYLADDAAGSNASAVTGVTNSQIRVEPEMEGKYLAFSASVGARDSEENLYGEQLLTPYVGPITAPPPAPTGAIEVEVSDNTDYAPVFDAQITVYAVGSATPAAASVFTDASGVAVIAGLPVGWYDVRAAKAGYFDTFTGDHQIQMQVKANETAPLSMGMNRLPTTGTVTVIVTDESDGQLEGALVIAEPSGGGEPAAQSTDGNGRVVFELAPGGYTFSASRPGYDGGEDAVVWRGVVVGDNGDPSVLRLTAIATGALEVTVRDELGGPYAGAAVVVRQGGTEAARFETGQNGGVTFGNLRAGDYVMEVSAAGYTTITRAVTVSKDTTTGASVQLLRVIPTPDPEPTPEPLPVPPVTKGAGATLPVTGGNSSGALGAASFALLLAGALVLAGRRRAQR